jgi:magnesium-protoporphyrin O-methyltransferase
MFPRGNRAPAVEPIASETLDRLVAAEPALAGWRAARAQRVASAFYKSHAVELACAPAGAEVMR